MANRRHSVCSFIQWTRREHRYNDWYAQEAHRKALRSRSWFKLKEINSIDKLFYTGMTVVDLGSTPGGWSLYAKNKIGDTGNIIACDILPMDEIYGVNFLQGDCSDFNILEKLYTRIGCRKAQIVLSDMSPNITGISIIDINRSIYLGNLALEICHNILISGGTLLVKVFQGYGFNEYLCGVHALFHTVKVRKPNASRAHSSEVYIVAKKYRV